MSKARSSGLNEDGGAPSRCAARRASRSRRPARRRRAPRARAGAPGGGGGWAGARAAPRAGCAPRRTCCWRRRTRPPRAPPRRAGRWPEATGAALGTVTGGPGGLGVSPHREWPREVDRAGLGDGKGGDRDLGRVAGAREGIVAVGVVVEGEARQRGLGEGIVELAGREGASYAVPRWPSERGSTSSRSYEGSGALGSYELAGAWRGGGYVGSARPPALRRWAPCSRARAASAMASGWAGSRRRISSRMRVAASTSLAPRRASARRPASGARPRPGRRPR